ncbi:MAG: hypothetical protein RL710_1139 [Pseudomonadota bacterium]|jgi:hypothetical protein
MDISLLLSSISGSIELGGLLVNERDRQKAAAIQSDLTEKLIQAQTQVSHVLAAIIEKDGLIQTLTQRNRELEASQSDRARYQLAKLGTVGDFFAYQLRAPGELGDRRDEPTHFLCQPCFDAGKKSVLLVGKYTALCSLCKTSFNVAIRPAVSVNRLSGGWMSS